MINSVELVSGVQHSDLVIHVHVSILFQSLFPFRLLCNIEQHSLCYTVGPCWLSALKYRSVYMSFPNFQSVSTPQPLFTFSPYL